MKRIVIFASGSGTNAENIIKYFKNSKTAVVTQVLCNNKKATVFKRCVGLKTNCLYFSKADLFLSDIIFNLLQKKADYIVLAGFLWKIPKKIIDAFPKKIINIHPSLLPKYGGKGMYGINVHNAVKESNDTQTGITIHYVNENYDEGAVIFQAKINLSLDESPKEIAEKVHQLEYEHFPRVIEEVIKKQY